MHRHLFIVASFACTLFACRAYDRDAYARLLDATPEGDSSDAMVPDVPATDDGAPTDHGAVPDDGTPNNDVAATDASLDAHCTNCNGVCVDTTSDPSNCNGCGIACPGVIGGRATCQAGVCNIDCAMGRHLCGAFCADDNALETCGSACSPCAIRPHAVATCDGTACRHACDPGHGDCNGDLMTTASDGCETDLSQPAHCGACGTSCMAPSALCATAGSSFVCSSGCSSTQTSCGSSCVDTTSDVNHCGSCTACAQPRGTTARCASSTCLLTCNTGFADCDHDLTGTGCEIDTRSDAAHCGSCSPCPATPNGTVACTGGVCTPTCNTGFVSVGGACRDFGGVAVSEAAMCGMSTCLTPNPEATGCACPVGFTSVSITAQSLCGTNIVGGTWTFCEPASTVNASSWGGMFLQVGADATCAAGACTNPNPYTGVCSCPAGATSIPLRVRKIPGGCMSGVAEFSMTVCARAPTSGSSFFGAYEQFSDPSVMPQCLVANPWTSACSCPAGATQMVAARSNATGGIPMAVHAVTIVFCIAP